MRPEYTTANKPDIAVLNEPVELKKMNVCDTAQRLYSLLIEIEDELCQLNSLIFGSPKSELCAGNPDCLESNIHLALDMANMIDAEIKRLRNGLSG